MSDLGAFEAYVETIRELLTKGKPQGKCIDDLAEGYGMMTCTGVERMKVAEWFNWDDILQATESEATDE